MSTPTRDIQILLAADASDVQAAVKRILIDGGHRVYSARDGNDAADAAVKLTPALILTTPDLPHVRGAELIEIARRARAPLPLGALFLVSPTDSRSLPLGHLVKAIRLPVGASALHEAVDQLLEELEENAPPPMHVSVEPPSPGWARDIGLDRLITAPTGKVEEGSLSSRPLAELLLAAMDRGITARLVLRAGEVEKRVHLLHGRPVNCETNLSTETLGEMLRAEKLVSADELEGAREHMVAKGCSQSEALVATGAIDRATLASAMERHVRERIVNIFSWDQAEWRLEEVGRESVHPLASGLEPLWLVLEGTRRYTPPRTLLDFFDDNQRRYPCPAPSMRKQAPALAALVGGARVAESLDGKRSLTELQVASGLDELLFTQIMIALQSCGLVTLEDVPLELGTISWRGSDELIGAASPEPTIDESAGRAARDTLAESPGEPEVVIETDPVLREDILELYTRLGGSDPFDVLGVDDKVDAAGVATALARWAARVGPDRMGEVHDEKLARLARQVWLRLEEAYQALSDDEGRKRWKAERQRLAAGTSDRRIRWLDADRAFRAGREHLLADRFSAAAEAFRAAEEMNRREPVYRLYAAWADWLAAREAGDQEGMMAGEEIACRAIEAIPVLDEGWVFLGEMALNRKDVETARSHLERALLFNPGSNAARKALARLPKP